MWLPLTVGSSFAWSVIAASWTSASIAASWAASADAVSLATLVSFSSSDEEGVIGVETMHMRYVNADDTDCDFIYRLNIQYDEVLPIGYPTGI